MNDTVPNEHPNLALLGQLAGHFPEEIDKLGDLFADNFVLHYHNAELPDVDGDYTGFDGIKEFFARVGAVSDGTFQVTNKKVVHVGDELIVTHVSDRMTIGGRSFEVDALFIWRVIDGLFAEAWDIPAVNTIRPIS